MQAHIWRLLRPYLHCVIARIEDYIGTDSTDWEREDAAWLSRG